MSLDPDPHDVLAKADALPHASDVDVRADPAPVQADSLHLRIFEVLESSARTSRFVALRLPGLDAVAHYYLRYAEPEAFGDVTDDERRRFGMVLDGYYGVLDAMVGRLYATLGARRPGADRVEPRDGAADAAEAPARAAGRRPASSAAPTNGRPTAS